MDFNSFKLEKIKAGIPNYKVTKQRSCMTDSCMFQNILQKIYIPFPKMSENEASAEFALYFLIPSKKLSNSSGSHARDGGLESYGGLCRVIQPHRFNMPTLQDRVLFKESWQDRT